MEPIDIKIKVEQREEEELKIIELEELIIKEEIVDPAYEKLAVVEKGNGEKKPKISDKVFRCQHCEYTAKYKVSVLQHSISLHSDPSKLNQGFKCEYCGKAYVIKSKLEIHKRVHTGEKRFECNICQKKFAAKSGLDYHQEVVHSDERPLECSTCHRKFANRVQLRQHEITHGIRSMIKCDICNKTVLREGFSRHKRSHTNKIPHKIFQCQHCDYRVKSKSAFLQHSISSHSDPSKLNQGFKCEHCGKVYVMKSTLELHKRVHTGEKPFECNICQRKFAAKSTLDYHQGVVHSDERPLECSTCHQKFANRVQLRRHELTHGIRSAVECDICNKTVLRESFSAHIRLHATDKIYKCNYCIKSFHVKSYLQKHERRHPTETPVKCTLCDNIFISKYRLGYHMRLKHADEKKLKL